MATYNGGIRVIGGGTVNQNVGSGAGGSVSYTVPAGCYAVVSGGAFSAGAGNPNIVCTVDGHRVHYRIATLDNNTDTVSMPDRYVPGGSTIQIVSSAMSAGGSITLVYTLFSNA